VADNRTLGEIKAADVENLEYIIQKQCKEHLFPNGTTAAEFVSKCLFKRLRKLGVKVNGQIDERFVEAMLEKHNVKVENRRYEEEQDKWREGIYIYKDGEIVGFISQPTHVRSEGNVFLMTPQVSVKTNIKPGRV